jgi:hypothetical protein
MLARMPSRFPCRNKQRTNPHATFARCPRHHTPRMSARVAPLLHRPSHRPRPPPTHTANRREPRPTTNAFPNAHHAPNQSRVPNQFVSACADPITTPVVGDMRDMLGTNRIVSIPVTLSNCHPGRAFPIRNIPAPHIACGRYRTHPIPMSISSVRIDTAACCLNQHTTIVTHHIRR